MAIFSSEVFKNQHALVTGATGGIGYETAKVLARMGADITITGRKEAILKQLKEVILSEQTQVNIDYVVADLAESSDREKLIRSAQNTFGPISLLVNSAGISGGSIVEELSQDVLERIMHLNYTVSILLSQEIYKTMKENEVGAIVNVSSLSGLRGTYGGAAYVGSKFALNGFTQSFALEAIKHNVRVNAVCPGYVDTKMGRDAIRKKADRENNSFEEQWEIESRNLPSGRITTAEEVANTIAFLLSDAAENIVGEAVKISGGSVMR
ncbi:MAG: SDR family oxidoreductase [Alkalibacterium sp.]|uniref:3-oxoacyl-[acyl-carrier protein] reductase n=1 Tax=Alkalibacterium gilvum TaxID=1130080 RepID=A0A1H6UNI0_9LACT|nr:SDR family oxidoreductase [Alkalibacterium gilvum]MDN6194787.1 SDR family oxidoreductase [Alkalibacterium sp.]MDN6294732.1 SDR family oxidoreductase [Alkalibacterium sp.]MDN6398696.1 SDR family oxidoreductase [Alkalibacterium sp.]MDN6729907.1 SDR family oxidoreductase [Alkalibacterium sp.]SEI92254.1 3-oxoacyl-[acyl-carrier protein] reductase [Alkalibacterium gilvum]